MVITFWNVVLVCKFHVCLNKSDMQTQNENIEEIFLQITFVP